MMSCRDLPSATNDSEMALHAFAGNVGSASGCQAWESADCAAPTGSWKQPNSSRPKCMLVLFGTAIAD